MKIVRLLCVIKLKRERCNNLASHLTLVAKPSFLRAFVANKNNLSFTACG